MEGGRDVEKTVAGTSRCLGHRCVCLYEPVDSGRILGGPNGECISAFDRIVIAVHHGTGCYEILKKLIGGRFVDIGRWAYAAIATALLGASSVAAQNYPNKPVRIIVGFSAGSVSDLTARVLAQKIGSAFGQPFIVEVRPGGGSNVAAQFVARAPKDGYTLFVTTASSTIRGAGSAKLGFDFSTDFAPIALIANGPFILSSYPGLGVSTVQQFIALAKATPDKLTFGSSPVGTTGYLAARLFNQRTGIDLPIAPYPSTAQAQTDLMTGRISIAFASAANVMQLIEEKKLTALAVAQPKRTTMMPNVPTIDEAG